MCSKQNCINPVFPGLEELHDNSNTQWYCSTLREASEAMSFCRGVINYDPALKAEVVGNESVAARVMRQDADASQNFFFHLAGLGYEGWDYRNPGSSDNDCVKSIWRMACYTHFPRSQIGCTAGAQSMYLRPCQSSCQNYVRSCGVECCDESVQCVFTHEKKLPSGAVAMTEGYAAHDGPCTVCTGGARRTASSPPVAAWLLPTLLLLLQGIGGSPAASASGRDQQQQRTRRRSAVAAAKTTAAAAAAAACGAWRLLRRSAWLAPAAAVCALSLQGCNLGDPASFTVPSHTVGNWRAEPDYLITYEFVPPGGSAADARINSCSLSFLSQTLQCSGRGVCKMWTVDGLVQNHPAAFCECDRDWADPECRTRRKSQFVAYLLSLFFGMFGADQFYLGFYSRGVLKLLTLGGGGLWWVVDLIRVGSAPVHTPRFRVAADLPHWAFAVSTVTFAMLLGFLVAYFVTLRFRVRRRKDALLLQAEEEALLAGGQYHGNEPAYYGRGDSAKKPSAFAAPAYGSGRRDGIFAHPQKVVI